MSNENIAENARGVRKERTGLVVSDVQDKTIVVRVDRLAKHKRYKKVIRVSKKYYAHDENNDAKVGDTVQIVETRPLSKLKRWRLGKVIQRGK
jgi:small subunit ribosomal protein S17